MFRYDLADQAIGVQVNVPNPDQVQQPIPWTIAYDANGNRTNFHPYAGTTDVYTTNNLSEYTQRTRNGTPASAVYNFNGDVMTSVDGSVCTYDAQNRLLSARKNNGPTMTFTYDGLNRQVSRTVNGDTTYNVWDGWDLIEEINAGGPIRQAYVYGVGGLITDFIPGVQMNYYYQDGSGSTSHVTDENGTLKEWYRYDLQGTPFIYDANNNLLSATARNVHHLFTGQQWYKEVGLYDLRNRFYSPDIGRFLQPDLIGFRGDRSNLYRHCGNNPITRWDLFGLEGVPTDADPGGIPTVERVWVDGPEVTLGPGELGFPPGEVSMPGGNLPGGDPGGGGPGGRGGRRGRRDIVFELNGQVVGTTPGGEINVAATAPELDPSLPPLGSPANPIHFSDSLLFQVLANEREALSSANLQKMGRVAWAKYMLKLNVPAFYNSSYYSYDGYLSEMNGVYSGHEINYLGEGMGFAASGMSIEQMTWYIYAWKDSQYVWYGANYLLFGGSANWNSLSWSGIRGSELMWAHLGYTSYANGGHL